MPKLQIVAGAAVAVSAIGVIGYIMAQAKKSLVTVTVNNFNGGIISGARVQLGAQIGTTNSLGQVILTVVYGTRTLSASAVGFTSKSQNVTINQPTQSLSITLSPTGSLTTTIAVTVTDSVTHLGVSGATYTIAGKSVQTDSSGRASVMVNYGTYSTSTQKVGYNTQPGTLVASQPNQSVSVSLVPISGSQISVTLSSTPPGSTGTPFLTRQTMTVKNNGVPVSGLTSWVWYECQSPGCTSTGGGGYRHGATDGATDANGQFIYNNHLPSNLGAHLYRDWADVVIGGVHYRSLICEINTTASGGGTAVCGL